MCGKKRWIGNGDTWWCKEEVNEAFSRTNDAHKGMCQNRTEENERRCISMKKRAVSKAMRGKVEEATTELINNNININIIYIYY